MPVISARFSLMRSPSLRHGLPRLVERVRERLLERDRRLPAGRGPQARRVAADDREVGSAGSRRVALDSDRAARQPTSRSSTSRISTARPEATLYVPAGNRGIEKRLVGAADVTDVGDVAPGAQVADEHGPAAGLLRSCDLRRPGADREALVPARALVLERAGHDDVEPARRLSPQAISAAAFEAA